MFCFYSPTLPPQTRRKYKYFRPNLVIMKRKRNFASQIAMTDLVFADKKSVFRIEEITT